VLHAPLRIRLPASDATMPLDHTIHQGECIFSIANQYGHKWETIWNAPENAALRKERALPGVLRSGDHVSIPDLKPKVLSLATNQRHKIVVSLNLITIRIRLMQPPPPGKDDPAAVTASKDQKNVTFDEPPPPEKKDDEPRKNAAWEVRVDGAIITSGKSDGDGYIEFKLRPEVKAAELIVAPNTLDELRLPLALGGLDPVTTVSGVKQRLYNLGFDCGDTNDDEHENLSAVIAAFQEAQGLKTTGEIDDPTRDRLRSVHGF
jgi:hypothetical protein